MVVTSKGTELTRVDIREEAPGALMERVVLEGDLSRLSPEERVSYYRSVCESLGLNPLTQPFQYLRLNGRLVLYATRAAADQLRKIHGISIEVVDQRLEEDGLYIVHVRARDAEGRTDEEMGVVSLVKTVEDKRNPGEFRTVALKGEELANAIMKAVTKAKRRVTLSIAGLGWLDETEVDSIPGAQPVSGPAYEVQVEESRAVPLVVEEPPHSPAEPLGRAKINHEVIADIVRELAKARREGKVTPAEVEEFLRDRYNVSRIAGATLSKLLERVMETHPDLTKEEFMLELSNWLLAQDPVEEEQLPFEEP
jgi:hypothetical protein